MENDKIAIEVIKNIAIDSSRMLAERQRAIDALTLFRENALTALKDIEKKVDVNILKERAKLYIQRIKEGAVLSMNA
ncbi:MAG: hypothetical protein WC373_05115 [Smithella sp.]|jgi:hypothetical protein